MFQRSIDKMPQAACVIFGLVVVLALVVFGVNSQGAPAGYPLTASNRDPYNQTAGIATASAANPPVPLTFTSNGQLDSLESDTVDLPGYSLYRALYVGAAGNLVINDWDGHSTEFDGIVAGSTLLIRPRRILATGTTATKLVGLR